MEEEEEDRKEEFKRNERKGEENGKEIYIERNGCRDGSRLPFVVTVDVHALTNTVTGSGRRRTQRRGS